MSKFYVYEHWRPDLNTCFYVGKGSGSRAYIIRRGHYNDAYREILASLEQMGLFAEIRMVRGGLTEAEAFSIEQERIKFWRDSNVIVINQTDGGSGPLGRRHTEATRMKIGASHKGRVISTECREKLRKANLGKKASAETREKMRLSHLKRNGSTTPVGAL